MLFYFELFSRFLLFLLPLLAAGDLVKKYRYNHDILDLALVPSLLMVSACYLIITFYFVMGWSDLIFRLSIRVSLLSFFTSSFAVAWFSRRVAKENAHARRDVFRLLNLIARDN